MLKQNGNPVGIMSLGLEYKESSQQPRQLWAPLLLPAAS
jgi:hypothetical protein